MNENKSLQELLDEYQQLPEFSGAGPISVNSHGTWDSTPLHIAIYRRRMDEAKLLIDNGADVDKAGEYGDRPLQVALISGQAEVVKLLLEHGAHPELTDEKGSSSIDVARSLGLSHLLDADQKE